MVQLGIGNSRMKDFFDLWHLARTYEFDGRQLADAIRATFARRTTAVPADPPVALSDEILIDPAKLAQWAAFLRSMKRSEPGWREVIGFLRPFLLPLLTAAHVGSVPGRWPPGGPWE